MYLCAWQDQKQISKSSEQQKPVLFRVGRESSICKDTLQKCRCGFSRAFIPHFLSMFRLLLPSVLHFISLLFNYFILCSTVFLLLFVDPVFCPFSRSFVSSTPPSLASWTPRFFASSFLGFILTPVFSCPHVCVPSSLPALASSALHVVVFLNPSFLRLSSFFLESSFATYVLFGPIRNNSFWSFLFWFCVFWRSCCSLDSFRASFLGPPSVCFRKPTRSCLGESRMAEQRQWWIDRRLKSPVFLFLSCSFSDRRL